MQLDRLLLSLTGRIGRARYWAGALILLGVSLMAMLIVLATIGVSDQAVLISILVSFALAYPSYALMAKRFQDRGKPGITALLGLCAGLRDQSAPDLRRDRPDRPDAATMPAITQPSA